MICTPGPPLCILTLLLFSARHNYFDLRCLLRLSPPDLYNFIGWKSSKFIYVFIVPSFHVIDVTTVIVTNKWTIISYQLFDQRRYKQGQNVL